MINFYIIIVSGQFSSGELTTELLLNRVLLKCKILTPSPIKNQTHISK